MTTLTRRAALATAAAFPALALAPRAALAAAEMKGTAMGPFARFALGGFEVTTLLSGTRTVENPNQIFGLNATPEEFAAASEAAFIPTDRSQFFFTPTLVNTGAELVLIDAGLSPAGITAALAAAGYEPGQVDRVIFTHFHGDHIGGLGGANPTFPNATYVAGRVEFDHWAAAGNEGFENNVRPLADRFSFIDDGGTVAPGLTAMATFGHSPGHMSYVIESNGQSLMVIGDLTNHPVWSLARPDWEVRFDMDKAAAAAARRRVLGMLAADRMPFVGYHMPFPAVGFVAARGEGFDYVPGHAAMMANPPA
jgi:glyoxylase-like metal-dependent hydrolase (beta-lactamase superfamily II)